MKKKLTNILKFLFFLFIGILLIWLSLHQIKKSPKDWNEFVLALKTANFWLFIPVVFIMVSSHVLRALRWKILMEPMGYKTSLPNTFFAVMIGYMANMAVPRLGEVLKCTILARYEKVPAEKIVGTIVAERAFDVVCLGIVFLLALIFQFDVVMAAYEQLKIIIAGKPNEPMSNTKKYIYLGICILFVAFIFWSIITKRIFKVFISFKKIIGGVWEGLITATKLQNKGLFFLYSLGIWAMYLTGTWIGFQATIGTQGLGLGVALSCLAFASIGMIITPGGIGAYAQLLAVVLTLQTPEIPNAIGYANGTLQWFAQSIIVLAIGFICLNLLPIYNRNKL